MLLPAPVLEGWSDAIEAVTAVHGIPERSSLDTRVPLFLTGGGPPYSIEDLATLPVLDAAALVSAWRPSSSDAWGINARDLARALEAVVAANPQVWTDNPVEVVAALREPIYVDHYFRALTNSPALLTDRAASLIAAVELIRAKRWEPAIVGTDSYDFEPDWSVVDTVVVEMIRALANNDAELDETIDRCWELALELLHQLPDELPDIDEPDTPSMGNDPLNRAINHPYGQALQAVVVLGAWEHRNRGAASHRLADTLDEVLNVPGAIGVELRAVLASIRRVLEGVAQPWLGARADELFGNNVMGTITFDQTLKYSQPTAWFYRGYQKGLLAAARRRADHAIAWLLLAYLWQEPDYDFATIIKGVCGNLDALKSAAEEVAVLVQDVDPDSSTLKRAISFWEDLLNADRQLVPRDALVGAGRWAFVTGVDPHRWLLLIDRTIEITRGEIDYAIEVAERAKDAQPSDVGLRILRRMIGHGEPWEQQHIETVAVQALELAAPHAVGSEFRPLRTRLIERGRHEATDIHPRLDEE